MLYSAFDLSPLNIWLLLHYISYFPISYRERLSLHWWVIPSVCLLWFGHKMKQYILAYSNLNNTVAAHKSSSTLLCCISFQFTITDAFAFIINTLRNSIEVVTKAVIINITTYRHCGLENTCNHICIVVSMSNLHRRIWFMHYLN